MKVLKYLVYLLLVSIFLSGCNYKYLRTKPTTFINIKQKIVPEVKGLHNLNVKCIDKDEEIIENDSEFQKCDDYLTLDANKIIELGSNDINKSEISNYLFYVSNHNCQKFIEKFKTNFIKEDYVNKLVNLNIFGFGVNVGQVASISHEQFIQFNENLTTNIQKRKVIKANIENNISKTPNKYSVEKMLVDFVEYDKSCSLFKSFEVE